MREIAVSEECNYTIPFADASKKIKSPSGLWDGTGGSGRGFAANFGPVPLMNA